jgi:hypothetical protein
LRRDMITGIIDGPVWVEKPAKVRGGLCYGKRASEDGER